MSLWQILNRDSINQKAIMSSNLINWWDPSLLLCIFFLSVTSVRWVFKTMFSKGLVYRGYKVMPYSTACGTPISNFEAGWNRKNLLFHRCYFHAFFLLVVCFCIIFYVASISFYSFILHYTFDLFLFPCALFFLLSSIHFHLTFVFTLFIEFFNILKVWIIRMSMILHVLWHFHFWMIQKFPS